MKSSAMNALGIWNLVSGLNHNRDRGVSLTNAGCSACGASRIEEVRILGRVGLRRIEIPIYRVFGSVMHIQYRFYEFPTNSISGLNR